MKIAVIGAGLMGRAAVYDLARNKDVTAVGVYDIDSKLAKTVALKFGLKKTVSGKFDAGDTVRAGKVFKKYDAVISAVTYKYNTGLAKAAIKAGAHFFDLGGNNDAVAKEFKLNSSAKKAGVVVIPDCGLAPGMVSGIVAGDVARFDKPESVHIRVGGLPQKRKAPLDYQMLFSAEGLLNEYCEPVVAIRNGKKVSIPFMDEIESLNFRGIGKMEAFTTSGGVSTLPKTYGKILKNLDYKTIRWPGHCEKFKTMLDIGLASREKIKVDGQSVSPRALFRAVLEKNLTPFTGDMSLIRITTVGKIKGKRKQLVSEIVDFQDKKSGLTAMMRCTSFPITIIAWMACAGHIAKTGVLPQELAIDPKLFETELAKRNIILKRRWSR